jgi:hypothetical protein
VDTTAVHPSSTAPTLDTLNYSAVTLVEFAFGGGVQFAMDNLTVQTGPATYNSPLQIYTVRQGPFTH